VRDDSSNDERADEPRARYEVAVETGLVFERRDDASESADEPFAIQFRGRTFYWHAYHRDPDTGAANWPTIVTEVVGDDWQEVRTATERFLSALSFETREPMTTRNVQGVGIGGGVKPKQRPTAVWPRGEIPGRLVPAIEELIVADDDRLLLVLGYWRDGASTGSPFFRYLAYFNAIDVACDDYDGKMPAWVEAQTTEFAERLEPNPENLWTYLNEERRHAVAHATRSEGRPEDLDPNDAGMRMRFAMDSFVVSDLVRRRVDERWGRDAVRDFPIL